MCQLKKQNFIQAILKELSNPAVKCFRYEMIMSNKKTFIFRLEAEADAQKEQLRDNGRLLFNAQTCVKMLVMS